MGLYGMQKPFEYKNQTELNTLEQRAAAGQTPTQQDLLQIAGPFAQGNARSRALTKLRGQMVLNPDEQARLEALRKERAAQEQQYKAGAKTPEQFLMNIPGYKYALDTGLQAATRRAAAQGRGLSGNLLEELTRVGTGTAAQFYGQEADRLAGLAGAADTAGANAQYLAKPPATPWGQGAGNLLGELSQVPWGKVGNALGIGGGQAPLTGEAKWWADASSNWGG